jgi:hypothetical protein
VSAHTGTPARTLAKGNAHVEGNSDSRRDFAVAMGSAGG